MHQNHFWGYFFRRGWEFVLLLIFLRVSFERCFNCFLFLGTESFAPIGLPHFWREVHSFAVILTGFPTGTFKWAGILVAGIYDFVTFWVSVKTSGSWFAAFCKCIIRWTSSSHWFVRVSNEDNVGIDQLISCSFGPFPLSSPSGGKIDSSNWQSKNLARNRSPVKGSRYLIIGES